MNTFTVRHLKDADEFSACSEKWNRLWQRSFPTPVTVRSEGIVDWVQTFNRKADFNALIVESEGEFVSGIPLVDSSILGLISAKQLAGNAWSDCGNLLLDRQADPACLESLVEAVRERTNGLLSLNEVAVESPQWTAFLQAVDNTGGQCFPRSRRDIGVIDIIGDWERYQASWSGKHRRATKRYMQKLDKEFTVRLERHRSLNPQDLKEKMRIAFEIEDRSWKGDAGTSILKSERMPDHFLREAQQVQDCGCFDLWLLYADDRAIAFEYCHIAFGICSSNKIGYDGEFSKFGPGRILRFLQLKALHEEGECRLFDTFGFFDASKAQWCTRTYPIENLFVALRPLPNFLLRALTTAKPLISCMRNHNSEEVPKLVPRAKLELTDAEAYPLSFEADSGIPAVVNPPVFQLPCLEQSHSNS